MNDMAGVEAAAVEAAPAKLNLALHVRRRMADGYHQLETLFAFTRFGDSIRAVPAADWSLTTEGAPLAGAIGPAADNLVLRAAQAFAGVSGSTSRYHLHLTKRIPVAAGLGGGSADAAATLRLLNRLASGPLDDMALATIAATLGADVPACLAGRTIHGHGRGDQLTPGPDLTGTPVLLVNPLVAVETSAVFAGWDGVDRGPLGPDWMAGRNDLTASATAIQPVISDVLGWLCTLPGVRLARMSGSGASCYALFEDAVPAVTLPAGWWGQSTVLL